MSRGCNLLFFKDAHVCVTNNQRMNSIALLSIHFKYNLTQISSVFILHACTCYR